MRQRICLVVLFAMAPFLKCLSQIGHIRVLLGQSDSAVINYLDSLSHLRADSSYKVEKASSDGDLILHCDFDVNGQSFYNCRYVYFYVHSFPDGVNMCYKQSVSGPIEFAPSQLNFVKSNFKGVSTNQWEGNISRDYRIVATFETTNRDDPGYTLTYKLQSRN
jgi:hypothetical protein